MGGERSDAFVFFGATGDLAFKQIFPALQGLIRDGGFNMPIIGVARSGDLDTLRDRAGRSVEASGVDPKALRRLIERLRYVKGSYDDLDTFHALRRDLGDAEHRCTIWPFRRSSSPTSSPTWRRPAAPRGAGDP